jgi:very-short-patch-repair endonuclease
MTNKYFTPEVKAKQKTLDVRKNALKRNATSSELVMKGLLMLLMHQKKICKRVMFQKGLIAGNGYCIVDFYLPSHQLCIEVDGGYHFSEKQKSYDHWKNNYIINERHMRVFRITDAECFDLTPEDLLKYLDDAKKNKLTYSRKYFNH